MIFLYSFGADEHPQNSASVVYSLCHLWYHFTMMQSVLVRVHWSSPSMTLSFIWRTHNLCSRKSHPIPSGTEPPCCGWGCVLLDKIPNICLLVEWMLNGCAFEWTQNTVEESLSLWKCFLYMLSVYDVFVMSIPFFTLSLMIWKVHNYKLCYTAKP